MRTFKPQGFLYIVCKRLMQARQKILEVVTACQRTVFFCCLALRLEPLQLRSGDEKESLCGNFLWHHWYPVSTNRNAWRIFRSFFVFPYYVPINFLIFRSDFANDVVVVKGSFTFFGNFLDTVHQNLEKYALRLDAMNNANLATLVSKRKIQLNLTSLSLSLMKIIQTNTCHNLWLLPVIEVSSELTFTYTPSSGRESISFSLFIISNWKPTWSIGIVYFRAKFWRAPSNRQIYQSNQESMVKQIIFTHVIRFRYANFSEEKNAFIGKKSSILTGFFLIRHQNGRRCIVLYTNMAAVMSRSKLG